MPMSDDETDTTEVEEEEIEAQTKERAFEITSETEVELEDIENEDDYTGDREAFVNLLIEMNENNPVDVEFTDEDGDEVEEDEIEAVTKARDPSNDLVFSGNMRDTVESLFADEEWEAVDPAADGGGDE